LKARPVIPVIISILILGLIGFSQDAFAGVDNVSPLSGPPKTAVAIIPSAGCFGTPQAHFHIVRFNGVQVVTNACPAGVFYVPMTGVSIGINTITVEMGITTVTSVVNIDFTVPQPTLNSVSPSGGQPGQTISINGSNFPLNHNIKVFVGGTQVTTLQSNSFGSTIGSFSVPNLAPGNYIVKVTWDGGMPSNLNSSFLQKSFTIQTLHDSDGDGITDGVDSCPTQPETFNGFEDSDGCPDTPPPEPTPEPTTLTGKLILNDDSFTILSSEHTSVTISGTVETYLGYDLLITTTTYPDGTEHDIRHTVNRQGWFNAFILKLDDNTQSGKYFVKAKYRDQIFESVSFVVSIDSTPTTPIIPDWVRNIFIWYAEDKISDEELIEALQFLISENIIKVFKNF